MVVPFKTDAVALLRLFGDHDGSLVSNKHQPRAEETDRYLMGPHWHQWDGIEQDTKEDAHAEDGYQQVGFNDMCWVFQQEHSIGGEPKIIGQTAQRFGQCSECVLYFQNTI